MNYQETLNQPPNIPLAKKLKIAIWILSTVVLLLVGAMRRIRIPLPEGVDFGFLPPIYSAINSVAALLLIFALVMIKRKNVTAHKWAIHGAMACSLSFLLCYVAYHLTSDPTRFGGQGMTKAFYLLLLISHIVLAAISLPFILITWSYGITNQFAKHKSMARWVFWVWLYVAVSGPVCYLMLRPYY